VGYRSGSHDNSLKARKSLFIVIALYRKHGKIIWKTTLPDRVTKSRPPQHSPEKTLSSGGAPRSIA
ncbi:MAG TPA: hypothetical protein DDW68_06510, partial [Verrucomicrobiales bacterium]|nr:hypothetical protein [Verrucomicrobiales bacterium]